MGEMMNEGYLEAKSKLNDSDYGTRKLAHYNMWLLDPDRKPYPTEPYPGFPEDLVRPAQVVREEKAAKPKAEKAPKAVKAKRAKRTEGPTKQDRAVEIYRELAGDKAAVISAIQERLGMSVAGATSYYYNAKKLV